MRILIEVVRRDGRQHKPHVLTVPDEVVWYEMECVLQDYLSKIHQMAMCGMCNTFHKYEELTTREVQGKMKAQPGEEEGETFSEHLWFCEACATTFDKNQMGNRVYGVCEE